MLWGLSVATLPEMVRQKGKGVKKGKGVRPRIVALTNRGYLPWPDRYEFRKRGRIRLQPDFHRQVTLFLHHPSASIIAASSVVLPPLAGQLQCSGQAFPVSVITVSQRGGQFCAAPALCQLQPASGCFSTALKIKTLGANVCSWSNPGTGFKEVEWPLSRLKSLSGTPVLPAQPCATYRCGGQRREYAGSGHWRVR